MAVSQIATRALPLVHFVSYCCDRIAQKAGSGESFDPLRLGCEEVTSDPLRAK
jgi:hypothetical protein